MRSGGVGPSFTARAHGRGMGGPSNFPQHGVPSTSSHPEPSVAGSKNERAGLSSYPPHKTDQASVTHTPEKSESASTLKTVVPYNYNTPEKSESASALKPVVSYYYNPPVAGCEICQVRCTTLAVLEKHKNGKRHKKKMKKIEEMKNVIKSRAELQGPQNCTSNSNLKVSGLTQCGVDDEEKKPTENLPTEAISHGETEQQNKIPGQQRGLKRKIVTPPSQQRGLKRKIVTPVYCDLCNVKCDTQVMFDRHLSGKKHLANFERSKGHQATKGPVGLQALYPPDPNTEPLFHPQEGKYMPPHMYQEIPVETRSNPQFEENPMIVGSEALPGCGSHTTVTMAMEITENSVTAEPEIKQAVTLEANCLTGVSETNDQGSKALPGCGSHTTVTMVMGITQNSVTAEPEIKQAVTLEANCLTGVSENNDQGSEAIPGCGSHTNVTMAMEITENSVTAEPEIKQAVTLEANCLTGVSETNDQGSEALPGCGSHTTVTMAMGITENSVTAEPEIKQAVTLEANCTTGVSETNDQGSNPLT